MRLEWSLSELSGAVVYSGVRPSCCEIITASSGEAAETEPEKQIRERRIRFYRNNDLLEQDYFSVVFGTEFSILYLFIDEYVEDKDLIKDVYSEIYHAILEDSVYEKNIFIR